MRLFKKEYKSCSDEELMTLFSKGDRKAFEEIYERYEKFVLNFFYRRLWSDREKAEDFTHDLFAKLIDKPGSFDLDRNFKTWLFSIANNMCKNEYKKQEVRKVTAHEVPEGMEAKSDVAQPDTEVDRAGFNEKLKVELENLSDKHQEVFMLRHFEGLSLNEIADALGVNTGTVKSRLHHATKTLADKLAIYRKSMI